MNKMSLIPYFLLIFVLSAFLYGQKQQDDRQWWKEPYPRPFPAEKLEKRQSFIAVQGNHFVDEQGRVVLFKGVNISDPDKLVKDGRWSEKHFKIIRQWGANIVRVPIHPLAWRLRGPQAYLDLLDQAVIWASKNDLYLIFDWHSIGNLKSGMFQHGMYFTSMQETRNFWRSVAFRYKDVPTVAFYEIFNEPTDYGGQLGQLNWQEWKVINEELIDIIYAHDPGIIPLVGGLNWGYDLSGVRTAPVDREGIGYVSHPYPQKVSPPWPEKWEDDFGFVADKYPLFATEFGFMAEDDPGSHIPVIGDESYGRAIMEYFLQKGISWTVWNFDPDWPPQMILDWNYTPSRQGKFFRYFMMQR